MKLYGTTTSPFVRRVRVVAAEVGEPIELVITRPDEQTVLNDVSPVRKVPAAQFGDRVIFDSQRIIEWLVTTRGWGGLTPPKDEWNERNLVNALDEALQSIIQVFYLRRDGFTGVDGSVFEKRQYSRADAIFAWAKPQLRADGFGIPEITAACTLDWADFRAGDQQKWSAERAGIAALRDVWRARPSLASTTPKL